MKPSFTLIELLIYMGLFAVFITVLTNVFLSVLDSQLQSEATSAVQIDARYLLSRLVYDIHRASAVVTPAGNGQTSTSLGLTIGGSNSTYALSGNFLDLGPDQLNSYATVVSPFSVTRLGNASGKATLQISFTVSDQSETKNYQTTVDLR